MPVPVAIARSDEFIALGQKVDVFSGAADAFASKDQSVKKARRRTTKITVNKGSQLGPLLTLSATRLTFEAKRCQQVHQSIEMVNSGSTAIYYEWERLPMSTGFGSTAVQDAARQFFAPTTRGCILPATRIRIRFVFRP